MILALTLIVASTLTQAPPERPFALELGLGLLAGGLTDATDQYAGGEGGPALQLGVAALSESGSPVTFFGRVDATLFMNVGGGWFGSGAIHVGARLNLSPIFFAEAGVGGTSFLLPFGFSSTYTSTSMAGFSGELGLGARGGSQLQHTCAVRFMGGPVSGVGQTELGFSLGLACAFSLPDPAR